MNKKIVWMAAIAAALSLLALMRVERPAEPAHALAKLPVYFEPGPEVGAFAARGTGFALGLSARGADVRLGHREVANLSLRLDQASPGTARPENLLPGVSNYFLGEDPRAWRTGVPHYARVRYENIYPGVDLVYYGAAGRL